MKINKFQLIPHFLLLTNLIICLNNLRGKRLFLPPILLNKHFLLPFLLHKEFLYPISLYIPCSAILAAHKNLTLEIIGIFADLGYCHVGLLEDCAEGLENGIWFYSTFLNCVFKGLCLLLGNLIFLLWG